MFISIPWGGSGVTPTVQYPWGHKREPRGLLKGRKFKTEMISNTSEEIMMEVRAPRPPGFQRSGSRKFWKGMILALSASQPGQRGQRVATCHSVEEFCGKSSPRNANTSSLL